MTFQIRHDGRTFTVHTEVGGDEFTRVRFDAEDPQPQGPQPLEGTGDNDE